MVEYPVSNCMRHRQVVFGVAVLVCLGLVAVGCEYDTQDVVAPAPVEVTEPSLPDTSDNQSWLVPSMPGMWIGHPNTDWNADAVPGVVVIEPPCVYVVEVAGDGEVERAALELTYPEFRLDHLTETLWYNDIALVTGDRVITNGPSPANDDYLFWNRCTAQNWNYVNGLTPLNCEQPGTKWERSYCEFHEEFFEGLSFSDCEYPASDELSGLCQQIEDATRIQDRGVPPPTDSLPLPELHDMFPYHPDLELELTRLIGVIHFREFHPADDGRQPCVTVFPTASSTQQTALWGDTWQATEPNGYPLSVMLRLPFPQVRYDQTTKTLWNGEIGPIKAGDRVIIDPISQPNYYAARSYGDHKEYYEKLIGGCGANAKVQVVDIQTVEHYCTNNTPPRHQNQCQQAIKLKQANTNPLPYPPQPTEEPG
ncbi:MAG: hypothetical protein KTU85_00140 [Acidimicrobiia bacterium]|nr:hypothetical protein [Acidimicrobiia bacterium]MCY4458684.1 hypothetical protein [Acidimicrobiaceae bacterium]